MTVEAASPTNPPVLRVSVARGRLRLSPAGLARLDAEARGAAKAAGLAAAKAAAQRLPAAVPVHVTAAVVDLQDEEGDLACTATVQAYARGTLEALALAACAEALLAAWGLAAPAEQDGAGNFPGTRLTDLHVVQNVTL